MSEAPIIGKLMLAATKEGGRLFRNNCGTLLDVNGRPVKFGVANPGGSDLIGWRSVIVTPEMVGKKIAIFTAREVKIGRTKVTTNQQAFIDAVNAAGGDARIVRADNGGDFTIEQGAGF